MSLSRDYAKNKTADFQWKLLSWLVESLFHCIVQCSFNTISPFYRAFFEVPDIIGVFADGPVTGKLSTVGNVEDCLAVPFILIALV